MVRDKYSMRAQGATLKWSQNNTMQRKSWMKLPPTGATSSLKPWAGSAYTRKQVENKNKNTQKYSFGQSEVIIFQIASLLFLLSHHASSNPSLRQTTLSLPLSPYIWCEQVNSSCSCSVSTKLHYVIISQKQPVCNFSCLFWCSVVA